jgi:lipopolysaccharide export system permease protein
MKLLDRYLLAEFLQALLFSLLAFILIFVLVDVFEKLDFLIDHRVTVSLAFLYYLYQIPYITVLVMPVAMLLASMAVTGSLARHNEMISMKAAGLHLYRIFLPLFLLGLAVSLATLTVGETLIPATNRLKGELERRRIRQEAQVDRSLRHHFLYDGAQGRQYYIKRLDADRGVMDSLSLLQLDKNHNIVLRLDAGRGVWREGRWVLSGVIRRRFGPDGSEQADSLASLVLEDCPETPADFVEPVLLPDEMGFFELRKYIDRIRRSGGDVRRPVVDLYLKLSFPFANLIILLFGLPLMANARRSGAALSFAVSMLICFAFWGILQTGRALGHGGSLSPLLAAWLPNLVFGMVGAWLLHRAPK